MSHSVTLFQALYFSFCKTMAIIILAVWQTRSSKDWMKSLQVKHLVNAWQTLHGNFNIIVIVF